MKTSLKLPLRSLPDSGFTLVELLVAVAIFAVLSALGYGGLSNILVLQERQQQAQQTQEDLQRALLILARDFYQIVPRPVRSNTGEYIQAIRYDSDNNQIGFTKSGNFHPTHFNQSSLQRINYFLELDALYRQHWSVLDRPLDAVPSRYVLIKNVTQLGFRFMDNNRSWSKFWKPQKITDLPLAIEVTIALKDGQTFIHTFPILQIPT